MKTTHKILGLSFLVLMLLTLTNVSADDQGLLYQEQNKLVTISYEDVTITTNAGGMVPKFQYIDEVNDFEFNVMFKSVIEYLDFNEDGAFQYNETGIWKDDPSPPMPSHSNVLALSSIRWVFSGFEIEFINLTEEVREITAVHFSFVSDQVMDPFYSGFEMEIHAHMYLNDETLDGFAVIGASELKFDVVMRNWPWQRNDTNLALRFDVTPLKHTYQLNDTNGNALNIDTNSSGLEERVQYMDQMQTKNYYYVSEGEKQGYFAYANKAQYKVASAYEYGSVNASHSSLGDGSLQTYLCFEHFEEEVIYDPSIGADYELDKTGSLELIFVGVGVLMVMGIVLLRIKRK